MTISEKAAYLKGLMDGLQLDKEKPEGQMIAAIVDLLGDVSRRLADVEETTIAISDELDEIEEDLDAIEDFILDEDEDEVLRAVRLCREKKPLGMLFLGGNVESFRRHFHHYRRAG